MTNQYEGAVIPVEDQTEVEFKVMPVGIHRCKIIKIEQGEKSSGDAIVDGRGYPCKRVTFKEKKGTEINKLFFYHNIPDDDPARDDSDKKCKSAFVVGNMRRAMKLDPKTPLSLEGAKGKYFYIMVIRRDYFDPSDKSRIVKSYNEVNSIFWEDSKTIPNVFGNPADNDGKPAGDFVQKSRAKNYMLEEDESTSAGQETTTASPEAATKAEASDDSEDDF